MLANLDMHQTNIKLF